MPLMRDALARDVECATQVERAVDRDVAQAAGVGAADEFAVVKGQRDALADFLRIVEQGHAGMPDAESAADGGPVAKDGPPLVEGGLRDDGHVRSEEQTPETGQLGGHDVGQDTSGRQQAARLVKNGMQEGVGVQQALHDDIGLTLPYHADGHAGGLFGRSGRNQCDAP